MRAEGAEPVFKLGKKYPRAAAEPEQVVSVYLSEGEYEMLRRLPGAVLRKARYSIANGSLDIAEYPASRPTIFEIELRCGAGRPGDAAWTWAFGFRAHRGDHVVGALAALHAWRSERG